MTNKKNSFWLQNNLKIFKLAILIILLAPFLYPNRASAQQVSLSITPPLVELFIKPGKSVVVAYKLNNLGDPTFINLKVLPFEAKDNLGNIKIKPEFEGPVRFSLDNSDLKLDRPFFLKTGGSQQILLVIRIPENIADGDFYYSLLAETAPPAVSEGISSARSRVTIGSNILVTISNSGNVDIKPHVVLFDILGKQQINFLGKVIKIFDSSDKIPLVLIVENRGKNTIKPEGKIVLKGGLGGTAKYEIISKNILAGSQRLLEAAPSAQNDCKGQTCSISPSLLLSGFFIGRYNVSAQIGFGENSPMVFGTAYFFAFPFKLLAGILLAVFVAVVIIKRKRAGL